MAVGDNNPRVFAETIGLDAWRTPFDGERGQADLHIDVTFTEKGRAGGPEDPVRFRLSLRRAEVHVIRDSEDIIDVVRSTVNRAELPSPDKRHRVTKKKAELGAGLEAKVSPNGASAAGSAKATAGVSVTETLESTEFTPAMQVTHRPTKHGYAFTIANARKPLDGQPWEATTKVMKIHDTNFQRKRGEPPEVRVEIHCLREDLVIEDVQFTDSSLMDWAILPRKKRIAVEQFIRDELAKAGLPCGDLSEPFTRIVLADAIPSVEQ